MTPLPILQIASDLHRHPKLAATLWGLDSSVPRAQGHCEQLWGRAVSVPCCIFDPST
jgi:hypothetical protein